ncbi:MAG TPA: prepilin-type N-terminal cleavage/methylation domain-containing protein [Aquificae bacterium]|nr:prepilin-type N-terminal cleavage/methylation domain-containing protein [Aquificota bacterium]
MKKVKKAFRIGFSLIELSIVLIIIGLLMAAVMKGRDLIRSAEMKKFYNTFIKAWELAYTQYYDRTGMPLGAPLYVKENGNKVEIKDFVGADEVIDEDKADFVVRKGDTIENRAKEVGLELPNTGRAKPYVYKVSFTDVSPVDVWITFGSDPVRESENLNICIKDNCDNKDNVVNLKGNGGNRGNFMLIVNVP